MYNISKTPYNKLGQNSSQTLSIERSFFMSQLNQQELQSLRHIIGSQDTAIQKMQTYSQQAQDPQVKSYFQTALQDAQQTKQKLMSFLS